MSAFSHYHLIRGIEMSVAPPLSTRVISSIIILTYFFTYLGRVELVVSHHISSHNRRYTIRLSRQLTELRQCGVASELFLRRALRSWRDPFIYPPSGDQSKDYGFQCNVTFLHSLLWINVQGNVQYLGKP